MIENYYFTFGQVHALGTLRLKDYWVRVRAKDTLEATRILYAKFLKPNSMEPHQWSMCYKEKNFNSSFFPKGELLCLSQYSQTIYDQYLTINYTNYG